MFDLVYKFFPNLKRERDLILSEAHKRADNITAQAQNRLSELSRQISGSEKKISQDQQRIGEQLKELDNAKQGLGQEKKELESDKQEIEKKRQELLKKFEKLAGLTAEKAREHLLSHWEQKLSSEIAQRIREAEEQVRKEADEKAK